MAFRKTRMFTEGELDFIKVLWAMGEAVPEEIQKALHEKGRTLTYGTIRNVLVVMIEKGFVSRRKKGKVYLYKAKTDADKARRNMAQNLLKSAFDGSESLLMGAILKNRDIRQEELEEIERLIAERKKGNKK
ncbi:unnamed protein product [marine sediment metagenome]|uniref:Penicillinase repressor n=1 Tax=marine sediment metagenome TaxID=412755 RepID=X1A403_9ZZZZ